MASHNVYKQYSCCHAQSIEKSFNKTVHTNMLLHVLYPNDKVFKPKNVCFTFRELLAYMATRVTRGYQIRTTTEKINAQEFRACVEAFIKKVDPFATPYIRTDDRDTVITTFKWGNYTVEVEFNTQGDIWAHSYYGVNIVQ
jgi:hypothetical protein